MTVENRIYWAGRLFPKSVYGCISDATDALLTEAVRRGSSIDTAQQLIDRQGRFASEAIKHLQRALASDDKIELATEVGASLYLISDTISYKLTATENYWSQVNAAKEKASTLPTHRQLEVKKILDRYLRSVENYSISIKEKEVEIKNQNELFEGVRTSLKKIGPCSDIARDKQKVRAAIDALAK